MYMIYALIIYLFVLFISFMTLKLVSLQGKGNAGYIVIPVADIESTEDIDKLLKQTYYEETFNGKMNARTIILADKSYRHEVAKVTQEFENTEYILLCELCDFFNKKEEVNEQNAFK